MLVFSIPNSNNKENYIDQALENDLYKILKDKKFTEYTGIYYETDTYGLTEDDPSKDPSYTGDVVSDVNKREARIITYIEK